MPVVANAAAALAATRAYAPLLCLAAFLFSTAGAVFASCMQGRMTVWLRQPSGCLKLRRKLLLVQLPADCALCLSVGRGRQSTWQNSVGQLQASEYTRAGAVFACCLMKCLTGRSHGAAHC